MGYDQRKLLLPEHLVVSLRQLGMEEMEFTFWQHATDFLRERYETDIAVIPVDRAGEMIVYDYVVHSPYGEGWENDIQSFDYYSSLTTAIEEAINAIREETDKPIS